MATFKEKNTNIQFTVNSLAQGFGRSDKFGRTENGDFADAATDGVEPFVNAVEIDWNSANLSNLQLTQLVNIVVR